VKACERAFAALEGVGTACEDAAVETKLIKVNVYCWCVDPYSSSSRVFKPDLCEVPLEDFRRPPTEVLDVVLEDVGGMLCCSTAMAMAGVAIILETPPHLVYIFVSREGTIVRSKYGG
jgi:hypothetical protein